MHHSLRRLLLASVCAAILPACSSSHSSPPLASPPPLSRLAYIADDDGSVASFAVNPQSGQLTPSGFAATYTAAPPAALQQVAVAPGGGLAWALTLGAGPAASTYTANPTNGALTAVSVAVPLPAVTTASAFAVDPSLSYAYVLDSTSNTVQVYGSITSGTFSALGNAAVGSAPKSIAVHPSGGLVYVANSLGGTVSGFGIAAGGIPVALTGSPFLTGSAPSAIAIDSTGSFLFSLDSLTANLWVYTLTPGTGVLVTVSGSPFSTGLTAPTYVTVDPLRRFVWAGDPTGHLSLFSLDSLTGFLFAPPAGVVTLPGGIHPTSLSINQEGDLAFLPAPGGSVTTLPVGPDGFLGATPLAVVRSRGKNPSSMALFTSTAPVIRTSQFVYAASGSGVSGYSITAGTGTLVPVGGSPFNAGVAFGSVATDPYNRFAYATQTAVAATPLSQYAVVPGSGALSALVAGPSLASALKIQVDPSGQFAFVLSTGQVTPFPITQSTGALGSSLAPAAAAGASFLAGDPLGAFLFAGGASGLLLLKVDAATGNLTSSGSPVGTAVSAAVVSPTGRTAYYGQAGDIHFASITSPMVVTPVGISTTIPFGNITALAVDPGAGTVYAASSAGILYAYAIDPASPGTLTVQVPAYSISAPSGLAIDPSGQFLFASSTATGGLSAFFRGGLGGRQLLSVVGSPFLVGTAPSTAAVAGVTQ